MSTPAPCGRQHGPSAQCRRCGDIERHDVHKAYMSTLDDLDKRRTSLDELIEALESRLREKPRLPMWRPPS